MIKLFAICVAIVVTGCAQLKETPTYKDGRVVNADQKAFDTCVAKRRVISKCLKEAE